jgi:hypothetical protein
MAMIASARRSASSRPGQRIEPELHQRADALADRQVADPGGRQGFGHVGIDARDPRRDHRHGLAPNANAATAGSTPAASAALATAASPHPSKTAASATWGASCRRISSSVGSKRMSSPRPDQNEGP